MMATYYHPDAKPSWQGQNTQVVTVGPNDQARWINISLEVTAAQVEAVNTVFRFIRLGEDTVVLDGNFVTDVIDAHASTPTLVLDVGLSDGGTSDDPDYFVNGVVNTATEGINTPFATTAGMNTALGQRFQAVADYYVEALVQTAAATGAAGTITVSLLLGNKSTVAPAPIL